MLLIGVQVDGQGCTSTPLYATVENLQFEGAAAWTPAGWGGASLALRAPAYPLVAPKAAIAISWAYRLTLRANSITGVTVGIYPHVARYNAGLPRRRCPTAGAVARRG
jgi:hypothetical protein